MTHRNFSDPLGPGTPNLKGSPDWRSFTPRAGLRCSLTPDSNGYGQRGNRTKAGLYSAPVFHYDYRDLQVANYTGAKAFFENAKRAEVYGGDDSNG